MRHSVMAHIRQTVARLLDAMAQDHVAATRLW
jgi:hypothetical protein